MQPRRQTATSASFSVSLADPHPRAGESFHHLDLQHQRRSLDPHALRARYSLRHGVDEPETETEDEDDDGELAAGHRRLRHRSSIMTFPAHPLPAMQGPFEESMLDATGETGHVPYTQTTATVKARQKMLCREAAALEQDWNFTYTSHWRQHPRGKYHPLRKITAQIVFGVHLLHQRLEKSVADVADILLKHVNELDAFLQRANEDVEESMKDMLFRRKCLKVPMEHVTEFDRLLEDRAYRAQLLDGNVTIERTITRMSLLLNDYLMDMSTFREANAELDAYLLGIGAAWTDMDDDVARIYTAMCGNASGWAGFLQSLVAKTERLGVVLVQVGSFCNEIEKRCGAASRRSLIASRSSSRNSSNNSRDTSRAHSFRNFANNKPLPTPPNERNPRMASPATSDKALRLDTSMRQYHDRTPTGTRSPIATELLPDMIYDDVRNGASPASISSQFRARAQSPKHSLRSPEKSSQGSRRRSQLSPLGRGSPDVATQKESYKSKHKHQPRSEPLVEFADETEVLISSSPASLRKGQHRSPALTGKDSAYSSLSSGGSFAAPVSATAQILAHPRSMSSLSSPVQPSAAAPLQKTNLFPSSSISASAPISMPATPDLTSRSGAVSPALTAPYHPSDPLYVPPRANTAHDGYGPLGQGRRVGRKGSLSSLRRFFGRRKMSGGGVETVVE